jgi:hypothetical protein
VSRILPVTRIPGRFIDSDIWDSDPSRRHTRHSATERPLASVCHATCRPLHWPTSATATTGSKTSSHGGSAESESYPVPEKECLADGSAGPSRRSRHVPPAQWSTDVDAERSLFIVATAADACMVQPTLARRWRLKVSQASVARTVLPARQ